MATHHPYSFSEAADSTVTRSRHRSFELSDERGRLVRSDSDAPATARDSELERKESRAPLLIAGVASAALLGGFLFTLGIVAGEPRLSSTVVTETIPPQAALQEKLDAQALDRAHVASRGGLAPTMSGPATSAPVGEEPASVEATGMDASSVAPTAMNDSAAAPMSVEPGSVAPPQEEQAAAWDEPSMTPAPAAAAPSIELDSDNPYTPESEGRSGTQSAPMMETQSGVSDNPY